MSGTPVIFLLLGGLISLFALGYMFAAYGSARKVLIDEAAPHWQRMLAHAICASVLASIGGGILWAVYAYDAHQKLVEYQRQVELLRH